MTEKKTTALRRLISRSDLGFLMEAHDGLSGKIVQEAGFEGIWASGLAISASLGVRDSNEASWTQVLEVLEFMSDATDVPILVDGDTGYGNFNNVRRLVQKLEQREIAGVCIEDKLFPKTNSFVSSESQLLADVDEFCGKLKAAKDTQTDDDFVVVARVEALIAGLSMETALDRAEAYRAAGADAILIHSKRSDAAEIFEFATAWDNRAPLVIVPTTYYGTPTQAFQEAGINLVVWGNHLVRASVAAMRNVARTVREQNAVATVEDAIASVQDIFELQGVAELLQAESRYLSRSHEPTVVVLAASRGDGLDELTKDRPKAMIEIAGRPILHRLIEDLRSEGLRNIRVVAGWSASAIRLDGVEVVTNQQHATTGDLASLIEGLNEGDDDVLVSYGDLLMRRYILRALLDVDEELVVAVDSNIEDRLASGASGDYVFCSGPDDRGLFDPAVRLEGFSDGVGDRIPHGQWIGLLRARGAGLTALRSSIDELSAREDLSKMSVTHLLDHVASRFPVRVLYVNGHWLDVNGLQDLEAATSFSKGVTG
jgi:phosphoenolpyruvate phosphomutase